MEIVLKWLESVVSFLAQGERWFVVEKESLCLIVSIP